VGSIVLADEQALGRMVLGAAGTDLRELDEGETDGRPLVSRMSAAAAALLDGAGLEALALILACLA